LTAAIEAMAASVSTASVHTRSAGRTDIELKWVG
jgi:hypothetical protein